MRASSSLVDAVSDSSSTHSKRLLIGLTGSWIEVRNHHLVAEIPAERSCDSLLSRKHVAMNGVAGGAAAATAYRNHFQKLSPTSSSIN